MSQLSPDEKPQYNPIPGKKSAGNSNCTTKLMVAGLLTLAVIQVAVVIVLIYLGARVGDLSTDVDEVKTEADRNTIITGPTTSDRPTTSDPTTSGPTEPPTRIPAPIFSDDFDYFNLTRWKHEITLGGGGNWEFQYYDNNRSNSYVKDGVQSINQSIFISNHRF